jgi:hypothetical protein
MQNPKSRGSDPQKTAIRRSMVAIGSAPEIAICRDDLPESADSVKKTPFSPLITILKRLGVGGIKTNGPPRLRAILSIAPNEEEFCIPACAGKWIRSKRTSAMVAAGFGSCRGLAA